MSRKKIQNRIDDLEPEHSHGDAPGLIMNLTSIREPNKKPTVEDSPHPELTVQSWPDSRPDELKIATPSTDLIPEPYASVSILSVHTCENVERYRMDIAPDGTHAPACELWNMLSEDDLREEKRRREEKNEPIPELLAEYE